MSQVFILVGTKQNPFSLFQNIDNKQQHKEIYKEVSGTLDESLAGESIWQCRFTQKLPQK